MLTCRTSTAHPLGLLCATEKAVRQTTHWLGHVPMLVETLSKHVYDPSGVMVNIRGCIVTNGLSNEVPRIFIALVHLVH